MMTMTMTSDASFNARASFNYRPATSRPPCNRLRVGASGLPGPHANYRLTMSSSSHQARVGKSRAEWGSFTNCSKGILLFVALQHRPRGQGTNGRRVASVDLKKGLVM